MVRIVSGKKECDVDHYRSRPTVGELGAGKSVLRAKLLFNNFQFCAKGDIITSSSYPCYLMGKRGATDAFLFFGVWLYNHR